ncbi:MAG: glycosyltransferase [Myxococcales bacterium]|nr:glycosyltransferase [Myxococcales bacterium]
MSHLTTHRLIHVDTSTEWRGGQRQLELLLAGRPDDAWAGVPGSPLAERLGPPTVPLRPGAHPFNILTLRRVRAEFDLVAAHTPHAAGVALLAGLRTVIHRRVDFVPSPAKYQRAAHVIAVSAAVRSVLVGVGVSADRITIVPDGVELPPTPALPHPRWLALPRPLYACVGALVDHKGHRHAIDAMLTTPGTLVIAGEGPLRAALEHRIVESGLQGRVLLIGQVPDVPALLAAIDAFVHPSVEEGMGQVLIEAMWAGCRVVATTAGGIPEAVGDAGTLIPPGDPAALSRAMLGALGTEPGQGRHRASQYSAARMVAGTTQVYELVLGGP